MKLCSFGICLAANSVDHHVARVWQRCEESGPTMRRVGPHNNWQPVSLSTASAKPARWRLICESFSRRLGSC